MPPCSSGPRAILLGAGKPFRGQSPSALHVVAEGARRPLDWQLAAFETIGAAMHFVGGFHVEEVVALYPNLTYSINPEWEYTGSIASLLAAPLDVGADHYVAYADVVHTPESIAMISRCTSDVCVAVDSTWTDRYEGRAVEDLKRSECFLLPAKGGLRLHAAREGAPGAQAVVEFAGLLKFSPGAVEALRVWRGECREAERRLHLPHLVMALQEQGLVVEAVDIAGQWAELNAPQDLARFVCKTKSHTLSRLAPMVRESSIGEQVSFTVGAWRQERARLLARIRETFGAQALVVRSSSRNEDSWTTANAGAFLTLLNIDGDDAQAVETAIDRVIESYDDEHRENEVLVQKMVKAVKACGVAFTRTLTYGAPYYVINYDDVTSSTEAVTSGEGVDLKTILAHRSLETLPHGRFPLLDRLLPALRELESLTGHSSLDVEFAVDEAQTLHIFQVRPIAVDHMQWRVDDGDVNKSLAHAEALFADKQAASPFVVGERNIFGIMPDWNPAEIIGCYPRQLAFSLYRYLVTDEVWATQRAEYGYRDVRPQPLILSFAGHPYVDIRASFSSFVPAALDDGLAGRLVDHYIDLLCNNPQFHDKVEFEVAFTCMDLDFDRRAKRLAVAGFTSGEIDALKEGLRGITIRAMAEYGPHLATIDTLAARFESIARTSLSPLSRAFVLLDDCRRYGTLAFSHLARDGFVAVTILKSMIQAGLLTSVQCEAYLQSMKTVAKDFGLDAGRVHAGELEWDAFVARYAHLRPGTYEITSPSYGADPEIYLRPAVAASVRQGQLAHPGFSWDDGQCEKISGALDAAGLPPDFDAFDAFLRAAIEGREFAKFVFSRNLSVALDCLGEYGRGLGLSLGQASHVPIHDFKALAAGAVVSDPAAWLARRAAQNEEAHKLSLAVELPPLVTSPDDFRVFVYPESEPNFVGSRKVIGDVVHLNDGPGESGDRGRELVGTIVLIQQADPGYDWLFSHDIAGLVTCYGGANSHMAIRAAELNLPAAIGVGEKTFKNLQRARQLLLDAQNRQLKALG